MTNWIRNIPGGTLRIAVALALMLGATLLFWASLDYEVIAPNWDGLVRGIDYNPSHLFTKKDHDTDVTPEQIDRDLAQLSQITGHIRTYTVSSGMDRVPEIARRYGITVSLGIWLDADLETNEKEIELGIKTALANRRTIDRVFVGSEAIERGDLTTDQLNVYIKRVREALPNRIKITTGEPWSTWLLAPELGQYVDIVSVHLYPFWERSPISGSLRSLQRWYDLVQNEFPDKPLLIGEVGWPSEGPSRGAAEPSLANEAYFDRAFVQLGVAHLCRGSGRAHAAAGHSDPGPHAARAGAGLFRYRRIGGAGHDRIVCAAGRDHAGIYRAAGCDRAHRHDPAGAAGGDHRHHRRNRAGSKPVAGGAARDARGDSAGFAARFDPRALLQRAAADGDRDAERVGAARLREFRGHRPR
jgi:exo-beta-1,3-glucanase (GH17 family)